MNVFLDTSIANLILDIEEHRPDDSTWQQDIDHMRLLLNGLVANGDMIFYVNPSVKWQIDNTQDEARRRDLQAIFEEFQFTEFNLTIYPIHFPAHFISEEQAALIEQICNEHPALARDRKIIADAAFNNNIEILLTTDRDLAHQVCQLGEVRFMLPMELWDSINSH